MSIINSVEKYLDKSSEKSRFIPYTTNIKEIVKINELLRNDKNQLIILAEIIIFISIISSKVNYFLDKLEDAEDKLLNGYCSISDKFLLQNDATPNTNISNYRTNNEEVRSFNYIKQLQNQADVLNKKYEEIFNDKEKLVSTNYLLEKENSSLTNKYSDLQQQYSSLESKYKDSLREFEHLKKTTNSNILVQEELLQDSINVVHFQNQISQKELEIEDLKNDYEISAKNYKEKITTYIEKIELYEEKISSLNYLTSENDKLKNKLKELGVLKEKQLDYDDLVSNLVTKSRVIDNLNKEKQGYLNQMEKSISDYSNAREKLRKLEFDNKILESEMKEVKNENLKLENKLKTLEIELQNFNNFNEMKRKSFSEITTMDKTPHYNFLLEFDRTSTILDMDKIKDETLKLLEKEIEEFKIEKNEFLNNYKKLNEEIYSKNAENDILYSKLEEANLELKRFYEIKTKLNLENDELPQKSKSGNLIEAESQDLEFYKRSYEEHKNKVNREHELISSSLYELALQFMSLKNDVDKKNTAVNSKTNWLQLERKKNFP